MKPLTCLTRNQSSITCRTGLGGRPSGGGSGGSLSGEQGGDENDSLGVRRQAGMVLALETGSGFAGGGDASSASMAGRGWSSAARVRVLLLLTDGLGPWEMGETGWFGGGGGDWPS